MLGSLSSASTKAMQGAHVLFAPPYSWMWRVGMSAASMKYDNLDKVADVPELMNLITGYYLGVPDAVKAAQAAEANPGDRFSLNSLSHLFQGPTVVKKSIVGSDSYDPAYPASDSPFSSPSSSSSPLSSIFGGSSDSKDFAKDDYEDDEEKARTDEGLNEDMNVDPDATSGLSSMFSNMLNGEKKKQVIPKVYPASHSSTPSMWDMMNAGKSASGSGGSAMAQQLIKMAGPAMGLNPSLVNMAAPMISSFL
jgi:hypothetical protein